MSGVEQDRRYVSPLVKGQTPVGGAADASPFLLALDRAMTSSEMNLLVVLGPTASGKTRLGVRLAHALGGEVVSADSRQVYRGLNLGSGKDLSEYEADGVPVPYHLIDIVDLSVEFSVFEYQRAFLQVFEMATARHVLPVLVGGTGLYIEAVLKGYRMVETPQNTALRTELATLSNAELSEILHATKHNLHNVTDLTDRGRLVRAIEIATYSKTQVPQPIPDVRPLVLGTRWARETLRERIRARLKQRLEQGMIEEVESLHAQGVAWQRLELLGLEYRFIAQYLQGRITNRNDLFQKLDSAICQFARRQETWFRRMERNGLTIHWVNEADYDEALAVVRKELSD